MRLIQVILALLLYVASLLGISVDSRGLLSRVYYSLDIEALETAFVQAWLNDHHIDLAVTKYLEFGRFIIDVAPQQLGSGADRAFALYVYSSPHMYQERRFNLVAAVKEADGSLRLVGSPLPWFEEGGTYWETRSGFAELLLYKDMTGDQTPEWVIALGGVGGGHMKLGWLFVLNWNDGKFVNLSNLNRDDDDEALTYVSPAGGGYSLFPYGVRIELVQSATKPTQTDIMVRQEHFDTWGCTWVKTRGFAWDGLKFALSKTDFVYDHVSGCSWRNAETAFWAGQVEDAIRLYGEGILRLKPTSDKEEWERRQYIRFRLALADSLTGRIAQARAILASLRAETPESELMKQLIESAPPDAEPTAFCVGAYNVFNGYKSRWEALLREDKSNEAIGYSYMLLPTKIYVGSTLESFGAPLAYSAHLPDPKRAGCDPTLVSKG